MFAVMLAMTVDMAVNTAVDITLAAVFAIKVLGQVRQAMPGAAAMMAMPTAGVMNIASLRTMPCLMTVRGLMTMTGLERLLPVQMPMLRGMSERTGRQNQRHR